MKIHKISILLVIVLIMSFFIGCGKVEMKENTDSPVSYHQLIKEWKHQKTSNTITCWYTEKSDKAWLEGASKRFEKEYNLHVDLIYYDGVQFFSDMNQANQKGNGPDLYFIGNDQLEFARNSGFAEENLWLDDDFWKKNYPEVAKNAVTYGDKQYGYPIYFDTYCLVYDANLLENAPASIDDILTFADKYEDTGSTKAIFRWDIADPYINSMFIASYADLFGENGDNPESFKVNNKKSIKAMKYYQSLTSYLWMNKGNISHDTVKKRIQEETLVLGLCKTDILPILYEMQELEDEKDSNQETGKKKQGKKKDKKNKEKDKKDTNYQISYVPSLTKDLSSTVFSTTYSAVINPYGKNHVAANIFAMFLSCEDVKNQCDGNGKLSVSNVGQFDELQSIIYAQYINSKPVPKVMILGDYLSEAGITFDAIWKGENPKEELNVLQEKMQEKIE